MFFEISKTAGIFLTDPANIFFLILGAGTILLWTSIRRWGRILVTAAAGFGLLVAIVPLGGKGLLILEDRFPMTPLPERVDGVVVLAGMVDQFVTHGRGQLAVGDAAERLIVFADLARRYPSAKLVFSGGSGNLFRQDVTEAEAVRRHGAILGLDSDRIIFEGRSRNTHENAVFSHALAKPRQGETWILVTSAFHMPRAVGAFRRAGWTIVPHPVDYHFEPNQAMSWGFGFVGRFGSLRWALHEWTGLAVYWITGRTDAFFPGPSR